MAEDKLLDVSEAAQFLGVPVGTLYHMVSQRRVPCIRLSKRCLRFRRADIDELVESLTEMPAPRNLTRGGNSTSLRNIKSPAHSNVSSNLTAGQTAEEKKHATQ